MKTENLVWLTKILWELISSIDNKNRNPVNSPPAKGIKQR